MPTGYGNVDTYGNLGYKQDGQSAGEMFSVANKINPSTGFCLSYAVRPDQGQGYAFIDNSNDPTAWIWPEPISDPLSVVDTFDQTRYIVIDELTGQWWELGTREGPDNSDLRASYLDKETSYGGVEIPCEIRLREHTADAEHKIKEHVETHAYVRPQLAENKGNADYRADGMREAQAFEIDAYLNGALTPGARTKNVPENGDFVFDRILDAQRIQIGFKSSASEFLLTGMDQYYLTKDESQTRKAMSEHNWQAEFESPLLWLSRGPNPQINRATGTNFGGSFFSQVMGPDGIADSALAFSPADGLTADDITIPGNLGIIFSISSVDDSVDVLDEVRVYRDGDEYYIRVNIGGNIITQLLSWQGVGWDTILVKRVGGNIVIGENGVITNTIPVDSSESFTISPIIMDGEDASLFNLWIFDSEITDSGFEYFYRDLTENDGNALLPIWGD